MAETSFCIVVFVSILLTSILCMVNPHTLFLSFQTQIDQYLGLVRTQVNSIMESEFCINIKIQKKKKLYIYIYIYIYIYTHIINLPNFLFVFRIRERFLGPKRRNKLFASVQVNTIASKIYNFASTEGPQLHRRPMSPQRIIKKIKSINNKKNHHVS